MTKFGKFLIEFVALHPENTLEVNGQLAYDAYVLLHKQTKTDTWQKAAKHYDSVRKNAKLQTKELSNELRSLTDIKNSREAKESQSSKNIIAEFNDLMKTIESIEK